MGEREKHPDYKCSKVMPLLITKRWGVQEKPAGRIIVSVL